jgi:L-lactate utilization protein LutC
MSSREEILDRLRQARGAVIHAAREAVVSEHIFSDYPNGGAKELLEQFTRRLTPLKGEVYSVADAREAAMTLVEICRAGGITSCIRQADPLVDRVFASADLEHVLSRSFRQDASAPNHQELEGVQLSVTPADALVSRTGSVVLRSTSAGGRRLSVLPEIHCVIATESQLVPSLNGWLSSVKGDRAWSFGTIITGPSRTADIEKILVLGAHGPRRLIVIVIAEEK